MRVERCDARRTHGRLRWVTALAAGLTALGLTACVDAEEPAGPASAAPDACVDTDEATRDGIEGTPVWARFCPGPDQYVELSEVPSESLTSHLDLLDALHGLGAGATSAGPWCEGSSSGRYEIQIGYADGGVAEIAGSADPDCAGRLPDGALVDGPRGLGVYGQVMTAFGRQYADGFETSAGTAPLVCPEDPGAPGAVHVDGASASLDTGDVAAGRAPMTMPLTAVRGIVCTWPYGGEEGEPDVGRLTPEQAERVRIGLHAIPPGVVDCSGTTKPTYTAVVEDRTGTRRAVTIQDWICSTVIRGEGLAGTGFPWLRR